MNNVNGNTQLAQATCLDLCKKRAGATGCEVIWDQGNRGCYVHTQTVAKGNGVAKHMCWVFSKCKAATVRPTLKPKPTLRPGKIFFKMSSLMQKKNSNISIVNIFFVQ